MNKIIALALTLGLASCATAPPVQELIHLPLPQSLPSWSMEGGIYEIFIRNLTPEGTFLAAEKQLPRIKDLGVKTLWLMPFHPIGKLNRKGTLGSPYSIRDYYAVDPAAGTLEDFKTFVDSAHTLGLKVILDFVASHSAWDNKWVTDHPDWYLQDKDGNIRAPGPDWTDVAGYNYASAPWREEMIRVLKFWVEKYDVDGYRCDVAYRLPTDFWQEAITELEKVKPVLMLAEATETRLLDAGFQILYGSVAYQNLKGNFEEGVANDFARAGFDEWTAGGGAPLLRFITNHDETSWSEPPPKLFLTLAGSQAAAVGTFFLPGIPMVYNGQEIGSPENANLFEKTTYDWNSAPKIQSFYKKLLGIWAANPLFKEGSMDIQDIPGAPGVLSYSREDGQNRIILLVNFRNESAAVTLPQIWQGDYQDLWTDTPWTSGTLPPYVWVILKK